MINFSKLASIAKAASEAKSPPISAIDKSEQEQLSRRAALRRIGMAGGMTVLGLLTIDELARVSAQKLEQNELTRGIAKDFRSAGVAFADPGIPADDYEDCDTNEFGEIVWLGPGVCAKTPKKAIPVPKSCENPNADGNAPNCNECSSDYLAACFERADEKYSGLWNWSSRSVAKDVCRQAATGCMTLCSGDDSPAAVSDFAECYKTATSGI